jgi:hypothetical protein
VSRDEETLKRLEDASLDPPTYPWTCFECGELFSGDEEDTRCEYCDEFVCGKCIDAHEAKCREFEDDEEDDGQGTGGD